MKCKERAGFLIPHPCTREAEIECGKCGKPICSEHVRQTEEGQVCISCYKTHHAKSDFQSPTAARRYYRDPYLYPYYYRYRYWDTYDDFDDDDRAAFDSEGEGAGADIESDADGS